MKGQKGMWLDGDASQNPADTTRANLNVVMSDSYGALSNEPGLLEFSSGFNGRTLLGHIVLNNNDFVVFCKYGQTDSEIGYVDDLGTYKVIISERNYITNGLTVHKLDFNRDYPIHGTYQINNKGERIIAFTDGRISPKILNIDNLPNVYNNDSTSIFNVANSPTVTSTIEEGAKLESGTYYPIIALLKEDKSSSNWFRNYLPAYVTDDSIYTKYEKFDGVEAKVLTSKSLKLVISNIDSNYKYIRVGFIKQSEGVKIGYIYSDFEITGGDIVVNIGSSYNLESIDLSEILVDKVNYKSAKFITQQNDALYLASFESNKEPNQQTVCNNIILKWSSEKYTVAGSNSDKYHISNNTRRHFQHGEVYAFYIKFEYKWGWGRSYLLNGRLPESGELSNVTIDGVNWKKYQVEETSEIISNTGDTILGHFGFWENEDELYPTVGKFPTGRVRHFKFPSLNFIKNNSSFSSNYGTKVLDRLGVILSNLSLDDVRDCNQNKAISYSLSYAKRNGTNNIVVGQSPVLYKKGHNLRHELGISTPDLGVPFPPGGQYSPESITFVNAENEMRKTTPRIYPFEMLHSKSAVAASHYRKEYMLETTGHSSEFPNSLGDKSKPNRVIVLDYIETFNKTGSNAETNPQVATNSSCIAIPENINNCSLKYIPFNVQTPSVNNVYNEEFVELLETEIPLPAELNVATPNNRLKERTYLLTLLSLKKNVYYGFSKQELISTGIQKPFVESQINPYFGNNPIYGGDTYICDYSFNTSLSTKQENSSDLTVNNKNNKLNGVRVVHRLIVESVYNINLRHISDKTLTGYGFYYPKLGYNYLATMDRDKDFNQFSLNYVKDYHALMDIEYSLIWKGVDEENLLEPFSIIRGQEFDRFSSVNTWRNFKVGDIYKIPKNKGEITNLIANKDYLYIHTQKTLYRTKGKNITQTNNDTQDNQIYLGVGDIFSYPAFEVVHDELGYLGTQHKYSCNLSKSGYLFFDSEKGKWFLLGEGLSEISNNGLHNFFRDNSTCHGDNAFTGDGITSVYDEYFNRFLVSKKSKELINATRFKGQWQENKLFIDSLVTGDIVYKNGLFKTVL